MLTLLTAVYVESEAGPASDITVRHDGVLNVDYRVEGGYAAWQANTTGAITAVVQDETKDDVRRGGDILLEMGATGVIRHLPNTAGMGAVFGVNRSEEGDVTINLAEGSMIDITEGGGAPAVVGFINASGNNAGEQTGDLFINAAGTIRTAVRNRGLHGRQGVGIRTLNDGMGVTRVTSSGTVETLHAHAIYSTHWSLTSTQRDDLNTEEIEGNLIDVTAGKVLTRGGTAIHVDTRSANAAGVVRVGEGATVRAEIDTGADAAYRSRFGLGNYYIQTSWVYGWRPIDTDNDGADDALHPIIVGIYMRRTPGTEVSNGVVDRVIVHGTVETVGGQKDVDAAIFLDQRVIGNVEVGATGRVTSDSGLAIASGSAPPADPPEDYRPAAGGLTVGVAGLVTGDIRVRDDGALTAGVLQGGTVTGDIQTMGAGALTATVSGTVNGNIQAMADGALTAGVLQDGTLTGHIQTMGAGALTATVSGTVNGNIQAMDNGALTAGVLQGGTLTGHIQTMGAGALTATVSGTVNGNIQAMDDGALTAGVLQGGTVTGDIQTMGAGALTAGVLQGGTLTGHIQTMGAGALTATVSGTVNGNIQAMADGALTAGVLQGGTVTGDIQTMGAGGLTATVSGTVNGNIQAMDNGALTAGVLQGGTLTGNIQTMGAGALTATVSGTVNGNIEGLGGGDHTVDVPRGGTVTGTVRLAGSTVTVGGTVGRITLDNGGTVLVTPTGQVTGVSSGNHGVRVGPGGTIENRGTIAGTIGIQAAAGSTVVNAGTVRSTGGARGIAMNFQKPGAGEKKNTLTLRRGMTVIGKIQGLGTEDTVNLSDLAADEVGVLTFVDKNERPVPLDILDIRGPRPGGVGRFIPVGNTMLGLDTTAFALTDDVLSDLTGSIHAAVLGTGLVAQVQDGVPAQGRVWATPFGGWREQTGNGTSLADGTHTFGGGLVGAGWGTPALSVGGFIGGSAGQLAVAGSRQNVDMQTVFGGAYAQQALEDVRLDARVLVGHVAHDATRRVKPGTAHATYTAFLFSPEVGVALRMPVTTTLHAMPRLRVRYAGLFTEGFRERAQVGNWDVGFAARSVQILEGRGEVSLPIALEAGGQVAPRLGLEGRWLVAGEMVKGTLTLPGGSFQVSAGGDPAVVTGTLGLGLTLPVAAGTTLVGNFDGALTTEHAWRATGYLGLTYSF